MVYAWPSDSSQAMLVRVAVGVRSATVAYPNSPGGVQYGSLHPA
jgi:hypothetical protein